MNLKTHSVLGLSVFLRIPVSEPPKCTDPISRLATGSLLTDLKNLFYLYGELKPAMERKVCYGSAMQNFIL